MSFPIHRGRRLRRTPALRALAQETRLAPAQLVAPIFVRTGQGAARADRLDARPRPAVARPRRQRGRGAGRRSASARCCCSGSPTARTPAGSAAWDPDGPVPAAIARIREAAPDLSIWADVCLCEYTDHGHCGVLDDGVVDNDATLPLLARAAVAYAVAGADVIAPSDMMDGRVGAIRAALDAAGCAQTAIVSYAAKYASAFYGPFREAAGSTPQHGDRRGYQMDPPNVREAMREALADVAEGADMVMVKPGLPYLDVIRAIRERVDVPVVAYQVSGEFAMLCAAAERGWIDGRARRWKPRWPCAAPAPTSSSPISPASWPRRSAGRRWPPRFPHTDDPPRPRPPPPPGSTAPAGSRRAASIRRCAPLRRCGCDPIAIVSARGAQVHDGDRPHVHRLHRRLGTGAARARAS